MLNAHLLMIIFHATSATAAFIVGLALLFQRDLLRQRQLAMALVVLLILLEIFLILAILSHLTSLAMVQQIVFGGLGLLGLYMIWRALQALVLLRQAPDNQGAVMDHVGFNLISLFDGFAIVSAIDLQAPGWLVAIIAIGAVALGIYAINSRKKALNTIS
ncbi:hypothetical protein [Dictyobacter formicarum]|uniref:Uncharacterized protein n=1 Tax=Dictyobacter formicarum TaxID=2778368 RepID=A0ABQ3VCC4_9CHLR|nr:hypothetical protein [Dictyobacter formicarum]GHO83777.1 hypothetical protein KSZ_17830 [Dictyobacter formicarum]